MSWYGWVAFALFSYCSLGFFFYPLVDYCLQAERGRWLANTLMIAFLPPMAGMIIFAGLGEMLYAKMEHPTTDRMRKQLLKILFRALIVLPSVWPSVCVFIGEMIFNPRE